MHIIYHLKLTHAEVRFWSMILWWLGSLRKLDEQPEWLKGGKLRDYQLEGLNFLVNRYTLMYIWNMHSVNWCSESLFILMRQLEKWYKCCFSWWNGSW